MNTTVVTALFNIDRETKGDNRKWSDYLDWFKDTLQLKLPMVIFIAEDLIEFVEQHRPAGYQTKIVIQEIPYGYLEPTIEEILADEGYRAAVKDNNRVECILPYYNILQYSKFKWLKQAAYCNWFDSDYFFWMDAGISRFIDVHAKIKDTIHIPANKLCIQKNPQFDDYPMSIQYIYESQCLLCGTIFGGTRNIINLIDDITEKILLYWIDKSFINNEQIMLAYVAKQEPKIFNLILNDTDKHLCLYEKIFT